jgi:hypothetical protein
MIWVCRRGAHLNPLASRARDWSQIHFVDLLMEIPQDCRRRNASGVFEELEQKARFFARLPCLLLCRKKCVQKPNIKAKTACQPRMQAALFGPEGKG